MAPQHTQALTSPQLLMMQQQSQNMSNALNLTQQTQPPFIGNNQQYLNKQQNQQYQTRHQSYLSSEMTTFQQQQQQPTMNQFLTSPITPLTPNQQQLQIFLSRQRVLQQQQQTNTIMTNSPISMDFNRSLTPTANDKSNANQHTNIGQLDMPITEASPELTAQFKSQLEDLLRRQQLQAVSCSPANRLHLKHFHQRQIQQLQQMHSLFVHQHQQQQQQQQQQTNPFIQRQTVMNNIQHRQQTSNPISGQQRIQATNMVRQLDENIRTNRAHSQALGNLTALEKKTICETVMQMRPLYEKIGHLLPIFLALTSNIEATRRLIIMKYMFEDQLNALPQNVYLITLERLRHLREQFNSVFVWIQNTVNGNSEQFSQSQPRQPQRQHINHQSPSILHTDTSPNTTPPSPSMQHSSNSPFIKRENADLNLPPSKKQRTTTDQTTQQQRQWNSATDPTSVYWSQPENFCASIPDCARAVAKTDSPSSIVNIAPTSTESVSDAAQQRPGTMTIPNDPQSQMVYQLALSSGIPANIVAILPAHALKCTWLLYQGSLNKIKLADDQKAQIHRMLDGYIKQAKEQLGGKDHISRQSDTSWSEASNFLKMDQQQLCTIDLTLSPLSISTPNHSNCALENTSAETTLSQDFQQKTKSEMTYGSTLSSLATVSETTPASVVKSSTSNTSAEPSKTIQPAIATTVSDYLRPDVGSEDNTTNTDTLNDITTVMTNPAPSTETSRTPFFEMDDFIIEGNNNNNNNNNTDMTTTNTGESYNNDNTADTNASTVFFSESPSSIICSARKEGFKDEPFSINELDTKSLSSTFNNKNNNNSLLADQSSNSSSLSSTSLLSNELNEELVKNTWYQLGMDKDSLGISETVSGLDFDSVGFISYDSGNRLSHPPLF
ncbi:unnamed protein product [Absidia cylindrospora]